MFIFIFEKWTERCHTLRKKEIFTTQITESNPALRLVHAKEQDSWMENPTAIQ
jgi:hypothetical protein